MSASCCLSARGPGLLCARRGRYGDAMQDSDASGREIEPLTWGLEWLIGGRPAYREREADIAALARVPVVSANGGTARNHRNLLIVIRSVLIHEMKDWPERDRDLVLGLLEPHRRFREKNQRLAEQLGMTDASADRLRESRRDLLGQAAHLLLKTEPKAIPSVPGDRWWSRPAGRVLAVGGVLFGAVLAVYLAAAGANGWWPATPGGPWPVAVTTGGSGRLVPTTSTTGSIDQEGTTAATAGSGPSTTEDASDTPLIATVIGEEALAVRARPNVNDKKPPRIDVGSQVELLCFAYGQSITLDSNDVGSDLWHLIRIRGEPTVEGFATDVFLATDLEPGAVEPPCPPSTTDGWAELEINERQGEVLNIEGVGIFPSAEWVPGTEVGAAEHGKQVLAECFVEAESVHNGVDYASPVWLRVSVDGVDGWLPDTWVSRGEHGLNRCA